MEKFLSVLLGALMQQIPKLVTSLTEWVSIKVENQRVKSKNRKAAKRLKNAKTKEEHDAALDDMP